MVSGRISITEEQLVLRNFFILGVKPLDRVADI